MTKLKDETKVIFTDVRLSYANLFEPRAFEGQEPKYSVSLLIPKTDTETLKVVKEAIANAKAQGVEKFGAKWGGTLRNPLRDGDADKPDDENYAGHYFINASSKTAPKVVGKQKDKSTGKAIELTEEDVYSGCYANVSVNFYPYNTVSKGIGAGLNNVQKERDGARFGGRSSAEEDFEDFEEVEVDDVDDFLL